MIISEKFFLVQKDLFSNCSAGVPESVEGVVLVEEHLGLVGFVGGLNFVVQLVADLVLEFEKKNEQ